MSLRSGVADDSSICVLSDRVKVSRCAEIAPHLDTYKPRRCHAIASPIYFENGVVID